MDRTDQRYDNSQIKALALCFAEHIKPLPPDVVPASISTAVSSLLLSRSGESKLPPALNALRIKLGRAPPPCRGGTCLRPRAGGDRFDGLLKRVGRPPAGARVSFTSRGVTAYSIRTGRAPLETYYDQSIILHSNNPSCTVSAACAGVARRGLVTDNFNRFRLLDVGRGSFIGTCESKQAAAPSRPRVSCRGAAGRAAGEWGEGAIVREPAAPDPELRITDEVLSALDSRPTRLSVPATSRRRAVRVRSRRYRLIPPPPALTAGGRGRRARSLNRLYGSDEAAAAAPPTRIFHSTLHNPDKPSRPPWILLWRRCKRSSAALNAFRVPVEGLRFRSLDLRQKDCERYLNDEGSSKTSARGHASQKLPRRMLDLMIYRLLTFARAHYRQSQVYIMGSSLGRRAVLCSGHPDVVNWLLGIQ
ncbi:hypothetical protein EVAR_7852_1 [Eumeta japonica]|uniref:Uncharacterized protein n=1 Tax=Eumeta variegata TaxID=151549 RepID=A0A4C1TV21_EUMVA|nr:hypothetical protein EVAR_7852_1 [Eumeta japonica]